MIAFVDAHFHLWDHSRLRYPWLLPPYRSDGPNGSVEAIAEDYLPSCYRRDLGRLRLAGAVHVEAGAAPEDTLDETQWLSELADHGGLPTGIVAYADLSDPGLQWHLERQRDYCRVRGIRQIINWHSDAKRTYVDRDPLLSDAWRRGFTSLSRHRLSFDLQCYPGQMVEFSRLAERNPDIPVIINHLGMPILTDPDGLEAWRKGMTRLAALPHISVKLSGFGFVHRNWDEAIVRPLIEETIDLFGAQRAMAASDFPTDKLFATPDRVLDIIEDTTRSFSDDERRAIWGGNANRIYELGLQI